MRTWLGNKQLFERIYDFVLRWMLFIVNAINVVYSNQRKKLQRVEITFCYQNTVYCYRSMR